MSRMTVTAEVTKRCPYREEVDRGVAVLVFDLPDDTDGPELHALRSALDGFLDVEMSHEDYTRQLLENTGARQVTTRWTTAGMTVEVTGECST